MHRRHGMSRLASWCAGLGCVITTLLVAACDMSTMAFIQDKRVRIIEPGDRSSVDMPVTLRWTADEFSVTGRDGQSSTDAGYFAIFVDRSPIPPGKTLEWFATQDDSCWGEPCGTVDRLPDIYTTEEPILELHRLPSVREAAGQELHRVVIVLLDGTGARIGESAFDVSFNLQRKA